MKAMFDNFSTWLTLIMLIIFTTMVLISLGYPAGARFMPLIVGIPGILMCLIQLTMDWFATHKTKADTYFHSEHRAGEHKLEEYPTSEHEEITHAEEPEFGPETLKDELKIWIYFLAFMAGVILFGFNLSVPVLVALYLWREAEVKLPWALVSAAVCTGVMYFMFEWLLRFQLHSGFVTDSVLKSLGN